MLLDSLVKQAKKERIGKCRAFTKNDFWGNRVPCSRKAKHDGLCSQHYKMSLQVCSCCGQKLPLERSKK